MKNKVQLIGRLGAEPEVKMLDNGSKLAKFNLAITETYKNKSGEKVSETQWYPVVAWGSLADIAQKILRKGSQITVDGKLFNRSYTDRDGNKRTSTNIVANEFFLMNNPKTV